MTASIPATLLSALADRYRVERELGAGGMATVYLAHDLKHDRDVAIKVLHPELGAALGGERFLSEIRTTAKLQHPHILPLLDSGSAEGLLYYVMPYVAGETLRARLERERQLPLPDALRITREVADALGHAHSLGIVHRDIKPENILLQSGHALVADFGIALAVQEAGGQRMTQTGLSLGTPQYMSPEQAMGEKAIDARSDIYALGAVCYEMLTGEPPFTGPTVQTIVAKVLTERPTAPRAVRDTVPEHVEQAVLTALAKLPADRFPTAAAFADALDTGRHSRASGNPGSYGETLDPRVRGGDERAAHHPSRTASLLAPWTIAALATTIAAAGWLRPRPTPVSPVTRLAVALPPAQEFVPQWHGYSIALSPDGSRLAYVGTGPTRQTTQLWIRRLDALDATAVPGTAGISTVRWAPDGRALLISTSANGPDASLIAIDGAQSTPAPNAYDGDVGASGRIYASVNQAIVRRVAGGAVDTVARLGRPILSLTVLPDERAALVGLASASTDEFAAARIVAVSFANGAKTDIGAGVYARYLHTGHLLYVTAGGDAFVAPFDRGALRLTGPGVPVARVAFASNSNKLYPQITVADDGTLAYVAGDIQRQRLTWLDPRGRVIERLPIEANFWGIALSPDGARVAFAMRRDDRAAGAKPRGTGDVWVEDFRTGVRTQLTTADFNLRPSWSADGTSVLWARIGRLPGGGGLLERRADASEPERLLLTTATFGHSTGDARWLPDHRTLVVRTYGNGPEGSRNIYYRVMDGTDSTAHPVATSPADETNPVPSPDGSLLAYTSDESGADEIYVQPFPSGRGRLQVSHGGGSVPVWSADGRQLYYWDTRSRLIAVTIQSRPTLAATATREIGGDIAPPVGTGTNRMFDVAPDGRILVAETVAGAYQLVVVRNWLAGLARGGSR